MKELAQQIIEISNQLDELNKYISILKYQEKYKRESNVQKWFVQNQGQRDQVKKDVSQ